MFYNILSLLPFDYIFHLQSVFTLSQSTFDIVHLFQPFSMSVYPFGRSAATHCNINQSLSPRLVMLRLPLLCTAGPDVHPFGTWIQEGTEQASRGFHETLNVKDRRRMYDFCKDERLTQTKNNVTTTCYQFRIMSVQTQLLGRIDMVRTIRFDLLRNAAKGFINR